MAVATVSERLAMAHTPCPECDAGCVACANSPGRVYVFGPDARRRETDWELEAIRAGATCFRTWFDRTRNCWWADVRMVEAHKASSVATADDPATARLKALEMAVKEIPGVRI